MGNNPRLGSRYILLSVYHKRRAPTDSDRLDCNLNVPPCWSSDRHTILIISFHETSIDNTVMSKKKWFPYNKGGEYRKWYGSDDYIVNWENNGHEIRNFSDEKGKLRSRPQNTYTYFHECISWSKITSGTIAFRYKPNGFIYDVAGTSIFADYSFLRYLCGFSNCKVALAVLNAISPTLNYEVGHIASLPIIIDDFQKLRTNILVDESIKESRDDWDSFETSWDFQHHPMI